VFGKSTLVILMLNSTNFGKGYLICTMRNEVMNNEWVFSIFALFNVVLNVRLEMCPSRATIVAFKYKLLKIFYLQTAKSLTSSIVSSSSYTFPTLSWVGTTCFSSCCDKIRQLFLQTAACLTSTLIETGVTTTNATGSNALTCLPKHGGARDNKF
jgi:hypothetical protein